MNKKVVQFHVCGVVVITVAVAAALMQEELRRLRADDVPRRGIADPYAELVEMYKKGGHSIYSVTGSWNGNEVFSRTVFWDKTQDSQPDSGDLIMDARMDFYGDLERFIDFSPENMRQSLLDHWQEIVWKMELVDEPS
ncbi:MAG: hypothetical protein ACYSTI_13405 [Planctomycetota bacterium]|jgi:hypothetical protein